MTFWARFILAVLAAWRISHLLANEDGPSAVMVRLRSRLGSGSLGRLLDCSLCLSVWVAMPLAFFVDREFPAVAVIWLAISGGACLLERIGQPGVTLSRLPENEGGEDAVLWPRTSGSQER